MKHTRIYSRAKINLSLDVLSKRPDNYHEVSMIMQTIKLADIIDVTLNNTEEIALSTNLKYLPCNENNIAYKACKLFYDYTGTKFTGVNIEIFKKIPVSAGLAGGSTNASGVLLALNSLHNTKMSLNELMTMSKPLGADVPYCIHGGTMLAEGIGEKLKYISPFPRCKVVLCKPNFSVSTANVYNNLDIPNISNHPKTSQLISAIKSNNYNFITQNMSNVLEDVTAQKYETIDFIKTSLSDLGADGVLMSGSGPTVFGLFKNEDDAINAKNTLRPTFRDTHITDISNFINKPY